MSVARNTLRAAIWAFLSTAGSKAITLVGLALLARLLAPAEFGLLAFAMVYITYAETIGDLGTGMALVYWPDRRDEAAQVTFLVNLAAGTFWCVTTILLAPFIADFFQAPHGAPIVRTLAFGFILKYLGNTHDALAQKDLRFRARLVPDLSLASLKAIIALVLAWLGFGAWSIVWGHLAGVGTRTLLLWRNIPWRPARILPRDLFAPMLRYGRGIVAVNILAAITHHSDLAVVGRLLGTTALGLYQMATKIPETTVVVLLWVVSGVLFPAFSKLHAAGESLRRPYLQATRYVSAITFPAAAGLFLLARPIVLTFFGPAWAGAAPILAALVVYAAMRSIDTHAGDALKATGRADLLARLALLKAVVTVPALLAGARFGATGVAAALSIASAVTGTIAIVVASRIIGVRLRDIAASFAPSFLATAVMTVPVLLWLRWTEAMPPAIAFFGGVAAGFVTYAAALSAVDRELIAGVWRHLRPARPAESV